MPAGHIYLFFHKVAVPECMMEVVEWLKKPSLPSFSQVQSSQLSTTVANVPTSSSSSTANPMAAPQIGHGGFSYISQNAIINLLQKDAEKFMLSNVE